MTPQENAHGAPPSAAPVTPATHAEDGSTEAREARALAARASLAADIVGAALLRGEFVLSSGATSDYYLDKYLFETKPGILRRVAAAMAELLPPGIDRIAGPELGAVALAAAISLETDLPFAIVRKEAKGYSTSRDVEGELHAGERVIVVEDVVSTGAQAIRAAERLRDMGVFVESILAVVDREQGGPQQIRAAGFSFDALFRRRDLGL